MRDTLCTFSENIDLMKICGVTWRENVIIANKSFEHAIGQKLKVPTLQWTGESIIISITRWKYIILLPIMYAVNFHNQYINVALFIGHVSFESFLWSQTIPGI